MVKKVIIRLKNILIVIPVTLIFYPLSKCFLFLSYFNCCVVWIYKNRKQCRYCPPFTLKKDYKKRYDLYEFVATAYHAKEEPITYLEFGVASGNSFMWWLNRNTHEDSRYFGFDTFEGLPENWGLYKKGEMNNEQIDTKDKRSSFVKGLFQNTINKFMTEHRALLESPCRKIIHLDADLYSSTLFTLSQLYPVLKAGDILFFDEFNVPLHEFRAFKDFTESFYVQLEPIGAVNNFYQVAFIIK